MIKNSTNKFVPYLFLAACVLIAFAPVAWMQQCMKFDMTDQYFPWRYFVGECLQSGHLPLWNPYTHLGYPICADPQSGAWYPFVWLIGGVFGYTVYSIQIEFVLHVFLAGVGMFLLAGFFIKEKKIALTAAVVYMLCGFFSSNAQHLTWIISGTWIPFVVYYFLRFQQQNNFSDLLRTALCFFMLLTGGYPAFVIVVAYSLLLMSFFHLWRIKREKQLFNNALKHYILFAMVLILTNAVSIASFLTTLSSSVRSTTQELSFIQSNPFSPQALLSWLFPLASVKNAALFNTDISMSNGYIGLLGLAGLFLFILKCRTRKDFILFGVALFFLLLAFGDATPLRAWLYYTVPLFDRFRFPSLFRLFALLLFVVCSGIGWLNVLKTTPNKKIVNSVFVFIAALLSIGIIYSSLQLWRKEIVPDLFAWNAYIHFIDFDESIFIQGIWQFVFLVVVIILFNRSKNFITLLPWLIAVDMCVAMLVNNPVTVVNDEKPNLLNAQIMQLPRAFPIPELQPMEQFKDREKSIGPLWLNLGIWYKQPYWQGYNSYQSPAYYLFEAVPQSKYVLKNPLLYFSSSTSIYKDTILDSIAIANNPSHLYLQQQNYLPMWLLQRDSTAQMQITSFSPNEIVLNTRTTKWQWLTLLQQNNDGWHVKIDGHETKKYLSNYLFISSIIPEGNHEVTFTYENKKVVFAFWVSVVSLILIVVFTFKKKPV